MSKDLIIFAIVAGLVLLVDHQFKNDPRPPRHSLVDQHRAMEFGVKP